VAGRILACISSTLYLGFMGATRRLDHYDASTGWQPLFLVSLLELYYRACCWVTNIQLVWSIYKRRELRDTTGGDPWNGHTLEWSTPSPPPSYNYAIIPHVESRDACGK